MDSAQTATKMNLHTEPISQGFVAVFVRMSCEYVCERRAGVRHGQREGGGGVKNRTYSGQYKYKLVVAEAWTSMISRQLSTGYD